MDVSPNPKRSCDRCHALKGRCRWIAHSAACERCVRLGHICRNERATRRAGRKPQSDLFMTTKALEGFDDVNTIESQSINRMMLLDESLEVFLIGPTFCENHRQLLISQIFSSMTILKDAVSACALAWVGDSAKQDLCYRRASSALSTLRSLQVHDEEDAIKCLFLGASIHTFAIKVRVNDVSAICTETLARMKSIYDTTPHIDPEKVFMLPCMIMAELFECLLSCRTSTLRYKPPVDKMHVDRYVGLSAPLLPIFHDICELSHALSHADESDWFDIIEALTSLQQTVNEWQPSVPQGFSSRFTASETAHMLCQAQVLRTAALLIIHRLRYPYNSDDKCALTMASSIMTTLELTLLVAGNPVKWVEIAIVAACFEFRDSDRKRWFSKLRNLIGYSSQFKQRIEKIIFSFWMARDRTTTIYWYNVFDAVRDKCLESTE